MASKEWVLIVGGSILQWPAVRAARELGYKVMLTDRNPACYCASLVEAFIELSTFDADEHAEMARSERGNLAAVFTAGADPIVTVARAAEAAGCHGVPVEIAEICADKVDTRLVLADTGIPQPITEMIINPGDLFHPRVCQVFDSIPVIIKASKSSGSRGHTFLNTERTFGEVESAYKKAEKYSGDSNILIEEWLDGKVLSVETLWYNGTMIPLNAVERPFDGIIELGHYNPLVADAETYAAIWEVMGQAGRAVGMNETQGGHIFKGDLILTDDGPKVLELTTRLSGGFDSGWTSPLAHGVDYTKAGLLMALGRPLEEAMPYFAPRWYRHAACMAAFGPKEGGVIKEIKGIDEAKKWCDEVIVIYQPGDELAPLTDCTQRVAYCIASDNTRDRSWAPQDTAWSHASSIEVICE